MNEKIDLFPKNGEPTWDEYDTGITQLIMSIKLLIVQMQEHGELPKDLNLTNEQELTVIKKVFKRALSTKLNNIEEYRDLIKRCVKEVTSDGAIRNL